MKKYTLLILSLFFFGRSFAFNQPVTPVDSLHEYYETIDGTSGKELLDAIQQVAKRGYRTEDFRYDSVWLAYKYTDMRPDGYVWEIYSDCVFEYEKDRSSNTTQTGECKGYNREHAMCQSWFGTTSLAGKEMSSSKKNSPGSDIFHIYPTSYGMNSRRGNRPYGEVAQADFTSGNGSKYGTSVSSVFVENSVAGAYVEGSINMSTNVFEPADEYKGDIARSYFGTMVKWAGEWAFNKVAEGRVIFDATIDADTHYSAENNYGFTNYGLALMLSWHRQDPVSQKEVDRNNGIQKTQGNRNPFIDYPYLAEYIWGEMSGEQLDLDQLLCSADELFQLGVSNGYMGEVIDKLVDTIFWMVGDTQYDFTPINHGSRPRNLPISPISFSKESTIFMGWTDSPMTSTSDDAPDILYVKASDFPAINKNTIYYAVFAQKTEPENINEVITINKTDSADWTLVNVKQAQNKTDGAYWLLVKDASITSPVIDMQMLDSVAVKIRSYQSRTTVSIVVDGNEMGKISASTNTMQRYVWEAPEMTGDKELKFIGVDGTASYGVGINEISLFIGGEEITYTNYLTHASGAIPTDMCTPSTDNKIRKIVIGNQLYVQVNHQLYDCIGRVVNK
ncbi:MAG: endonuclease [Paludibacteraceae bacterium]|nr:endonuclease [Paludibacteraceae bacterium]